MVFFQVPACTLEPWVSALTARIIAGGGGSSSLFMPICSFVTDPLPLFFRFTFSKVWHKHHKAEKTKGSLGVILWWGHWVGSTLFYACDDKLRLSVWELCILWLLLWGMGPAFSVRCVSGHRSNLFICPCLELFVSVSRSCFDYVLWL